MIEYEPGSYGILFIFTCKGSVFPKALMWAIPAVAAAFILHRIVDHNPNMSISQVWSAYNFILGFLVVFRTQQAYQRFWEGATILQQVRGEWFNAVSSCFAFCSSKPEKAKEVQKFQHLLIRLASLLYCTALQQIAVLSDEAFEILDLDGVDESSLEYLAHAPEKCLVILQWVQRLIVQNTETGVLDVPPPILSRVYQELSRGIVNIVNAQKITDIVFPFPYAQMVTVMLIATTAISPYIMAVLIRDAAWCGTLTFVSVFAYWCINYIAAEIEMPFGEDANDLPIAHLQEGLNMALRMLLDDSIRKPPHYNFNVQKHSMCEPVKCPFHLITDVQHKMWGSCHHKLKKTEKLNRQKRATQAAIKSLAGNYNGPDQSCSMSVSASASQFVAMRVEPADQKANVSDVAAQSQGLQDKRQPEAGAADGIILDGNEGEQAQRQISSSSDKGGALASDGHSRAPRPPLQVNQSNPMAGSIALEASSSERSRAGIGDQNQEINARLQIARAPLIQPATGTLPENWKLDNGSEWLSQNPLLDNRLAGAIVRMQKHFLRISEDLTFITCHSSWPGAPAPRAEGEGLPDAEAAKFSAKIEESCCSIARALGGLAVVLCMRDAEGMHMPSWVHDAEGCTQPKLSAPAELRLPL